MTDKIITLLTSNCIDSLAVGIELARSLITDNVDKLEVIRKVNRYYEKEECPEGVCEIAFLDNFIEKHEMLEKLFANWIK